MAKLDRLTAKIFGETASTTNTPKEIGQFGSAKAGTYNATGDVAAIQNLPAWSNGWIDAVTPTDQFPPLPEMTGVHKVLSYQNAYLLQQGIPEWDSATTYYENGFCTHNGIIYRSILDENVNNQPDETPEAWFEYGSGDYANQDINNLTTLGNARLQYAPFAINAGTVLNSENNTLHTNNEIQYKKYNFVETGTLTKDKSIINGFSASNYIKLSNSFAPQSNTWEIQLKVKTGNSVTTLQNIISKGFGTYYGIRIDVDNTGHFYYLVSSSSGGSSTIMADAGATAITTNTDYWLNFSFDGSKYLAQISTDGVNWQTDYTKNSTDTLYNFTADTTLGYGLARQAIFTGEIDVAQCYIKINNQITWQGVIDGTSSDYDYTEGVGTQVICDPCTITTCDGRTKIFDSATTLEISEQEDGNFSIFKDYETGNLSLIDEFTIGKTNTVSWTQPVLSANGTMGGDSFAVEASSEYASSSPAWKAFDNNNSTSWGSSYVSSNVYIDFYNPQALNVTNLSFKNISNGGGYTYVATAGYVQISNDGANWTTIKNFTNSTTGDAQTWNIDLSDNTNFAKYYRVYGTTMSQSYGWAIAELKITANLKLYNYLDTSTIPANLKVNSEINNDLVYIGDCTISSGNIVNLSNVSFNATKEGDWVTLAESILLNYSTSMGSINIDLSSILPKDKFYYDVMLDLQMRANVTTTGGNVKFAVKNVGNPVNEILAGAYGRHASWASSISLLDKSFIAEFTNDAGAGGYYYLYITAYKRRGVL